MGVMSLPHDLLLKVGATHYRLFGKGHPHAMFERASDSTNMSDWPAPNTRLPRRQVQQCVIARLAPWHARVGLSAQTHALGFYEKAGFHVVGEPFMDAGIPHRKMVKELLLTETGPER
ncbi:MAG TPA: GNAT family N-acetyltransferase [Nitrospira sp.]|nr:GNAT family N-acetyltransferase [Nitrospira sp.]